MGITFDKLVEANKSIELMDIKGKAYAVVPERLKAFRMVCPDGSVQTEIVELHEGVVTMKATVLDGDGKILGTGFAQEKESSSFINKTSFIENCETSAVGRALGNAGFGFGTSVASAEEVANAMLNQRKPKQEAPEELPVIVAKPVESLAYVPVPEGDPLYGGKSLAKLWNEQNSGKNTCYSDLKKCGDAETKKHIALIDAYVAAKGGKA